MHDVHDVHDLETEERNATWAGVRVDGAVQLHSPEQQGFVDMMLPCAMSSDGLRVGSVSWGQRSAREMSGK